ncbi:hypothetical protein BC629DRAFT_1302335 [Irpex lacteus]|nr:hypothetical protein BC629DRAFT_1302335 [Irpex lacteus]
MRTSPPGHHCELIYRSDYLTAPILRPESDSKDFKIHVKTIYSIHGHALNTVWEQLIFQICDIIMAHGIKLTVIDPARFFTRGWGRVGPPVVWVGVESKSTTADAAHCASQEVLALLREHGVENDNCIHKCMILTRSSYLLSEIIS